ncbi:hypothetical protein CDD81_2785 [Ophiocordyceps australis]|uniref:Mitochondrial import inner membrane translocase subunit n=1 Tax=Ophiocordyceps australis TaxID=1399860 RepID=A0A2C5XXH4_9HYPO|nr:hypothetical protein CDD81_2785 [Ophiocordyceps australis]
MSNTDPSRLEARNVESSLENLSSSDAAELRQYMSLEEKRAAFLAQTHNLTQLCWKKCITGGVKSGDIDRTERTCLSNCVDRFFDIQASIVTQLNALGQN